MHIRLARRGDTGAAKSAVKKRVLWTHLVERKKSVQLFYYFKPRAGTFVAVAWLVFTITIY